MARSARWGGHGRQHPAIVAASPCDTVPCVRSGIGKPEPLRHMLTGAWLRRIAEEHLHLVDGDDLVVVQARFRYD